MIIGVVIRNFKTYKNINFIPLSNGSNFCGLIGQNGIGKSSILEALDCFFNNKLWIRNIDAGKSEISYVTPIIVADKDYFNDYNQPDFINKYSNSVISFITKDIPSTTQVQRKQCFEEIKKQFEGIDFNNKYVIPINLNEDRLVDFGIFEENDILNNVEQIEELPEYSKINQNGDKTKEKKEEELRYKRNEALKTKLTDLYEYIIDKTTYVYVPKDIEPERFVKFETEEIQHLIGTTLIDIVKAQLSEKQIKEISRNLKKFVDELSGKLNNYVFKTKETQRQPNLKAKDIYDLIINDFFTKRELHKENTGKDIALANLSTGEKQQAIISLIHSLVVNYRESNSNLIIAVDEPESALHISLCYDQFEKLNSISGICCQVLITSHWYGFIPTITKGTVVNITKENNKHIGYSFNIDRYREEIKIAKKIEKRTLPIAISLKGITDLIQSIISSVIKEDNAYNWLICEGSSDKIYLDEYLKEEVSSSRLRIVPVGGAKEIKKIYQQLLLAFEDLKSELKGKVYLLIDTDTQFYDFDSNTPNDLKPYLTCKRIVNNEEKTILVENQSNPKSPKTDIEDALNGMAFYRTLKSFDDEDLKSITCDNEDKQEIPSFYAMDLKISEYSKLDHFFSKDNNRNKSVFAKKYVQEIQNCTYRVPDWILEIKKFFK